MLNDGRTLGYADIGDPRHFPILYFHGFPGSRLEAAFAEYTIQQCGVRVIAVERPGYGLSSHDPQRRISDWPNDIRQLADALGLARFSLLGVSTGGVYALACAHALPDRVHSTGIAGTLAPLHQTEQLKAMDWLPRQAFKLVRDKPWLARLIIGQLCGSLIKYRPHWVVSSILPRLCESDQQAMFEVSFRREFTRSIQEAFRHGHVGPLYDLSLLSREWGFQPEDVHGPVHLWHGQGDSVIPVSMGRHLQARLPNCQSLFATSEGHLSIIVNYMKQALYTLSHGSAGHTTLTEALQPDPQQLTDPLVLTM